MPIWSDPTQKLHDALDLVRSGWATFNPLSGVNSLRSIARGKGYLGPIKGDTTQQGGLFVIDPTGAVLFAHRDQRAGEDEPFDEALAVLKG